MALFGKLFEKKTCDVCGGEIGLLGNRKLEDGNLCKNCAAKLSPWFSDRRHTTVEDIKAHLNYREENKAKVQSFRATRTMGNHTKLLVDEAAGNFIVTSSRNWQNENPDVIPMTEVADVKLDIRENKSEIKQERKTADGKTERISYNPPRYKYTYGFWLEIFMNSDFPWFEKISIGLNDGEISVDSYGATTPGTLGRIMGNAVNPSQNIKFRETERLGEEMRQTLLNGRSRTSRQEPVAAAPAASVAPAQKTCEYCGSTVEAGNGTCPVCGAPLD